MRIDDAILAFVVTAVIAVVVLVAVVDTDKREHCSTIDGVYVDGKCLDVKLKEVK